MKEQLLPIFAFFKRVMIFQADILVGEFGDLIPNNLIKDMPNWKTELPELAKTYYPTTEEFDEYYQQRTDELLKARGEVLVKGSYAGYPGDEIWHHCC